MMNVLQIAQAAAGELGLTPIGSLAGNSVPDAIQQLALLNREGRELADLEGSWPVLRGEQIITFVPGQEAYPFPTDIAYYRDGTGWDRTTMWRVYGPLSAQQWQAMEALPLATIRPQYRIMDGQIHFFPVPTSADTIAFEYISANWCVDANGNPKASFTADQDTPLLPEDLFVLGLKWRLLAARGMNYAEERAVYDRAVERKRARATAPSILSMNRRADRRWALPDPIVGLSIDPVPDGTIVLTDGGVFLGD